MNIIAAKFEKHMQIIKENLDKNGLNLADFLHIKGSLILIQGYV